MTDYNDSDLILFNLIIKKYQFFRIFPQWQMGISVIINALRVRVHNSVEGITNEAYADCQITAVSGVR